MPTTHPLPAPASNLGRETAAPDAAEIAVEEALVPSAHSLEQDSIALSPPIARLPVELDVTLPVRDFRVRNLLMLEPGQVIETQWGQGEDMPLSAGDVQLAWSEFEIVETELAVRITRLA